MNLLEEVQSLGIICMTHPVELEKLQEFARGKDVLEIGSFQGGSAYAMAKVAKSVFCVDSFEAATNGQRQTGEITTLDAFKHATAQFDNVFHLVGTSVIAAERVITDFDLVFLDAMHTYEECLADIDRWWPRVRDGGVLAIHDYRHSDYLGVMLAADKRFGPAPEGTTVVTLRWIQKT